MARATLSELIDRITNDIQENTSGDITATTLNELLDYLTNNLYLPTDSTVTVNNTAGIKEFTFGNGLTVVVDGVAGTVDVSVIPVAVANERVTLGSFATTATQNPTGTGSSGVIRINFGTGGTIGNAVTVAPDGTFTIGSATEQLRMEFVIRIGRTGGAGVAILHGRAMYAEDGIEANAVQLGDTLTIELDDADTIWREYIPLTLDPVDGAKLWFEIARDESGNNSGGLLTEQPSGTLSGWNQSDTAQVTFSVLRPVS